MEDEALMRIKMEAAGIKSDKTAAVTDSAKLPDEQREQAYQQWRQDLMGRMTEDEEKDPEKRREHYLRVMRCFRVEKGLNDPDDGDGKKPGIIYQRLPGTYLHAAKNDPNYDNYAFRRNVAMRFTWSLGDIVRNLPEEFADKKPRLQELKGNIDRLQKIDSAGNRRRETPEDLNNAYGNFLKTQEEIDQIKTWIHEALDIVDEIYPHEEYPLKKTTAA